MGRKTRKLRKETARKKEYLSYYQMMRKTGKQPMTAYHYKRLGRTSPSYFRGVGQTGKASAPRKIRRMAGLPD